MMPPTCWWWIRHAPVPGAVGKLSGQRDVECDCSDIAVFDALARLLPADPITVVSSLVRTRQTFDAIVARGAAFAEPLVEPAFAEQSFGDWEGLGWAEMEAEAPAGFAEFWRDPARNAPPGGESFHDVTRRVATAIERLSADYPGRDIVSVSHGGTIRAAVTLALDLSPEMGMAIVVDNLSVTRLDRVDEPILRTKGGRWRVQCVNAPSRWTR
jgi:alpha-ribazole phosphatase